ncbi:MAG: ATP-binding cassette domain-containing protein, partial [Clostridium sp.]|nr:ATP-binding cassette domain-containing protein [Clostridium sp.]
MKEIVRVLGLTKDYPLGEVTVHALRGVDFSIYNGEMVVILGPSGSGKSTTMNLLGGIETATSGEIWYSGEKLQWNDKRKLTEYRRNHVGFIFQFYNLLPGLTALENIALSAELGRDPLDAEELLFKVGLADRRNHFPNRLSGGEQQRVAIARALCKN